MLKNDKLDALIMLSGDVLIAKNVDLYRNAGVPILKRPRSLDKKVQKSINKEGRMQEFGAFYKYGRRVAAALLIACSISFAAVMSVKAVRTTLWNMIVEFFDEYLSVSFINETPPPQSIEETKGLFYDVEEWDKQVIIDTKSLHSEAWTKNGVKMLTYSQELLGNGKSLYDNENTDVENIEIRGMPAILMFRADGQTYSLSWSDGVYRYSLAAHSPEITKEELILIAETIE